VHGRDRNFRPGLIIEAIVLNKLDIPHTDLVYEGV